MKDFLNKNWINTLALGMVFTAFIYFLNLASETYDISPEVKIATSFLLGTGFIIYSIERFNKGYQLLAQIMAGLGTAVIFATVAFISFSEETNWSIGALITVLGIAVGVSSFIADKLNMRVLALISVTGGLITPFFIQATEHTDVPLFAYLLIINVAALFISVRRSWAELRYVSFILSIALYTVYYYLFEPSSWEKPMFYVSILFIVYSIGFLVASWKKNQSFDGIDLFLSIANSVNFVFWSHFILGGFELSYAIPIVFVGVLFMVIALIIYNQTKQSSSIGALVYLILGVLSLSIGGNEIGSRFMEGGKNYLIMAFSWLAILTIIYTIIKLIGEIKMTGVLLLGYVALSIYWFIHAWDVDWIPLFGVTYIPFINLGAIVWILLALFGFTLSKFLRENDGISLSGKTYGDDVIHHISNATALISHLIIGGLLTVQIMNLWEAYDISFLTRGLMVSLMWFIYALILYLRSNASKQFLYKILGAAVVVISTAKVMFFDLAGESTVEKVVFLLLFGLILFIVARVNQKTREKMSFPSGQEFTSEPQQDKSQDSSTTIKEAPWKKF